MRLRLSLYFSPSSGYVVCALKSWTLSVVRCTLNTDRNWKLEAKPRSSTNFSSTNSHVMQDPAATPCCLSLMIYLSMIYSSKMLKMHQTTILRDDSYTFALAALVGTRTWEYCLCSCSWFFFPLVPMNRDMIVLMPLCPRWSHPWFHIVLLCPLRTL
jgi:hypothetical protein